MDEADCAQEYNDLFLSTTLTNHRNRNEIGNGESAMECEDCGEKIPEARRRAVPGCVRCVLCQAEFEKWGYGA
jgi:phage/conjugal plasmid C-4 type zinc finger TraR family protein